MDGHLLRRLALELKPLLLNARLEKIHTLSPDVCCFRFYTQKGKVHLCLRYGRQNNFLFTASASISTNLPADAKAMLLRKYFQGRRLRQMVVQPFLRKLWLLFETNQTEKERLPWLSLDLRDGPTLRFLTVDEVPEEESTSWPDCAELSAALENWRAWSVLTPELRKTLALLDEGESSALFEDLRTGGGDVFSYTDPLTGRIRHISAWPLPIQLQDNLEESASENAASAIGEAGNHLVFATLVHAKEDALESAKKRLLKKLRRKEELLKAEEEKHRLFCAEREKGIWLQNNLWHLDKSAKASEVVIQDDNGIQRALHLDPKYTIAENMQSFFSKANKGKRGLAYVAKRKAELENEKKHINDLQIDSLLQADKNIPIRKHLEITNKFVEKFLSSDGFTILRGSNAKGNILCRKLAQNHDIWLHVINGPGSHVIIQRSWPNQEIPERTMQEAGCLAACKSWQKNSDHADIESSEVRYIRTMRGNTSGMVKIDKIISTYVVSIDHSLETMLRKA